MVDQLVGSCSSRWITDAPKTAFASGRPRLEPVNYSYSEGVYEYDPVPVPPTPHSIPPSPTIKIEYNSPHCACASAAPYTHSNNVYQQPSTTMIVSASGQTYYQPQPQQLAGLPGHHLPELDARQMGHPGTRASPTTVQWLLDNYETAEGVSLPRNLLYSHYMRHCSGSKIDPVNAASFGKLIRSVFIGLKTRRLGTRGNSKYHYYGIRIKPDSPLNNFQEDSIVEARRQQPTQKREPGQLDSVDSDGQAIPIDQQHQQFVSDLSPHLPSFPEFPYPQIPYLELEVSENDIASFLSAYREHCEAILDVVLHLQFQMVDQLWQNFWSMTENDGQNEYVQPLPLPKLVALCECQEFIAHIAVCDHLLYQSIVDTLIPNVLKPIPGTLTQAIRNFAKSLEGWLTNAVQGYPKAIVATKIASVVAFSQTLRRYTSLNHLAQAARAVLQNSGQVSQMLSDLNRVDFGNVQEQASWVCQCEQGIVSGVEQDFKLTLQKETSLEDWAFWLDGVVSQALKPHEGQPTFSKAARQFLLKWSFYSSMVIRDLTLRSAASFGSFHLIRLLFDEYMFYLVEYKVAASTGKTAIAIMSEFSGITSGAKNDGLSGGSLPTDIEEGLVEPPAKKSKPAIL